MGKAKEKPVETVTIEAVEAEKLRAADDLMGRIEAQEEATADAYSQLETAKAEAKLRKEIYDSAVLELRRLARVRKEELPLFDGKPGEWRNIDLVTAGLTQEHAVILVKADLGTFGELVTYMKSQGQNWFRAIHGLGPEGAAVVADAVSKFWADNEDAAKEFDSQE